MRYHFNSIMSVKVKTVSLIDVKLILKTVIILLYVFNIVLIIDSYMRILVLKDIEVYL